MSIKIFELKKNPNKQLTKKAPPPSKKTKQKQPPHKNTKTKTINKLLRQPAVAGLQPHSNAIFSQVFCNKL